MIAAITSYLKRRIYKISLVAPRLCDDSLFAAVNSVSGSGIVVLEDVDALFNAHREKKEEFSVTFSGLLNAIDGVGDTSNGVIFMFTTNHPEHLDPALCRHGRVDRSFRFGHCTFEISMNMFLRFYENETEHAKEFAHSVARCSNSPPTPAELQNHFIVHRKSSSQHATQFVREESPVDDKSVVAAMWS